MGGVRLSRAREGEETRARILTSAVRHFGAVGFEGASLRTILADAATNTAAANYHFGSKAGLYRAVVGDYFARTRERRFALLDAAELAPDGFERLRAVTRAYMRPHIELVVGEGEYAYGRLLLKMVGEGGDLETRGVVEEHIRPVQERYRDALRRCCPGIDDARLAQGIGLVLAVMVHAPFNTSYGILEHRSSLDNPLDAVLGEAAEFAAGGLARIFSLDIPPTRAAEGSAK